MSFKAFACSFIFLFASLSSSLSAIYHNQFSDSFDPSWSVKHQPFVLYAIPKCGTHYIQRIIHLMTPHDIHVKRFNSTNYITARREGGVIRSFEPFSQEANKFIQMAYLKMITMVRDPRDALISHLFYMDKLKDQGDQRDFFHIGPNFDALSIDERITTLIMGDGETPSYIDYYLQRIGWALQAKCLVVKYEDLVGNDEYAFLRKVETVQKIARYINLDLSRDHLAFIVDNMYLSKEPVESDGKVYEKATSGNWRNFLNETHKQLLKDKLGNVLIQLGYEDWNDW